MHTELNKIDATLKHVLIGVQNVTWNIDIQNSYSTLLNCY